MDVFDVGLETHWCLGLEFDFRKQVWFPDLSLETQMVSRLESMNMRLCLDSSVELHVYAQARV